MTDVAEKTHLNLRLAIIRRLKWTWICLTWYILSIGPMYWTWFHAAYNNEPSLVEAFYRPLIYACAVFPPLGALVNAYIELWVL